MTNDEFRKTMNEQLFTISSDLCANVLHAAIRLTTATKNSEDDDRAMPDTSTPELFPTKNVLPPPQDIVMDEDSMPAPSSDEAVPFNPQGDAGDSDEGRWSRVLRSRPRRDQATPVKKRKERRAESEEFEEFTRNNSFTTVRSETTGMPFGSPRPPEARQKSALQIVETLLKHPAMFYDKDAGEHIGQLQTDY